MSNVYTYGPITGYYRSSIIFRPSRIVINGRSFDVDISQKGCMTAMDIDCYAGIRGKLNVTFKRNPNKSYY